MCIITEETLTHTHTRTHTHTHTQCGRGVMYVTTEVVRLCCVTAGFLVRKSNWKIYRKIVAGFEKKKTKKKMLKISLWQPNPAVWIYGFDR